MVGRPFLYATTKEFLIRFGLNDLNDLPKVEDMAEALGFEPPAARRADAGEEMLPLGGAGRTEKEPTREPRTKASPFKSKVYL